MISNNESILFEETKGGFNPDATPAIQQLHRREMVKLVYDPDGKLMDQAQRKELGLPADNDFTVEKQKAIEIEDPPSFNKAKSMAPFGALKASNLAADLGDVDMIEDKSQVFQKRDRLFSVLSQV